MIQKATWIIPGILVTLLLGLLWAMPAFAADAGNIEFLSGDDEISYLSLNGLGGDGGAVMLQVEDQDLNKPATAQFPVGSLPTAGSVDWSNLADANDDGNINYQDFTAFIDGSGDDSDYDDFDAGETTAEDDRRDDGKRQSFETTVPIAAGWLVLNTQSGTLTEGSVSQPADASDVEYKIYNKDDISGRVAYTLTAVEAGESAAGRSGLSDGSTVAPPADAAWTLDDLADMNGDGKLNAMDITARNAGAPSTEPNLGVAVSGDNKRDADGNDIPDDYAIINTVTLDNVAANDDGTNEATVGMGDYTADETVNVVAVNVILNYSVQVRGAGNLNDKGSVTNRVRVNSDAFAGGMSVILTESAARSGKFQVMLNICDSSLDTCKAGQAENAAEEAVTGGARSEDSMGSAAITIPVNKAGDTIRVTYSDSDPSRTRTASIPLDVSGPSFSNLAPATGTAGREDEPSVSFDVQDTDSGISDDKDAAGSVMVLAGIYALGEDDNNNDVIYYRDDLKLEEATNGYSASVTIEEGLAGDELDADPLGDEYEIRWWAVSTDLAGNDGVSDSDGETKCNVPSTVTISALEGTIVAAVGEAGDDDYVAGTGCDPFVVRVDTAGPELDNTKTFTGSWLDGSEEKSGTDGKRTSIVVAFNEALDCSSVSADDFEVDGSAPNDVTCKGSKVYLDVDELDPNDRPDIEVGAESLTDKAGNLIGADEEVTANDGIPAKLTVSVSGTGEGDRVVTDEDITITIASDERLAGNPTVIISKVGDDQVLDSDPVATASPTGTVNEWTLKPVFSGNEDDGLWSVYVSGNDLGSGALKLKASAGTGGTEGTEEVDGKDVGTGVFTIDLDSKSAILFEVDNEVQAPAWSPDIVDNDFKTDNAGVFIRADFSDEGKEYGLGGVDATATPADDTREETNTPGDVATDFDTHGTVTLISASFNGDDVTESVSTRDWVLYVYRPGNLTNGDHVFKIEVSDNAGNEKEFTLEFAKTDRAPYKIELNPGPNLISFPGNPADGDINAVFGGEGNEDITNVLSFDNASGLWLNAMKGEDGMFMGDLTTINGMNGYWVLSAGVLDVSVVLEGTGSIERPPPHIAVQKGWNLIGVVDAQQRSAGTGIATSDYFANIDAQVVYGFDSLAGRLERLSIAKAAAGEPQDEVETGAAYWVYANEAGIIIP